MLSSPPDDASTSAPTLASPVDLVVAGGNDSGGPTGATGLLGNASPSDLSKTTLHWDLKSAAVRTLSSEGYLPPGSRSPTSSVHHAGSTFNASILPGKMVNSTSGYVGMLASVNVSTLHTTPSASSTSRQPLKPTTTTSAKTPSRHEAMAERPPSYSSSTHYLTTTTITNKPTPVKAQLIQSIVHEYVLQPRKLINNTEETEKPLGESITVQTAQSPLPEETDLSRDGGPPVPILSPYPSSPTSTPQAEMVNSQSIEASTARLTSTPFKKAVGRPKIAHPQHSDRTNVVRNREGHPGPPTIDKIAAGLDDPPVVTSKAFPAKPLYVDTVTLSGPAKPENTAGDMTMLLVVVPLVCAIVAVLALTALILWKRRRMQHTRKRPKQRDAESLSEVTATLIPTGTGNSTGHSVIIEPIYAVVDKSKKRRNTESLSANDETVLLHDVSSVANGSCAIDPGSSDSLDISMMPMSTQARDGVFDEEILYDEPPREFAASSGRGGAVQLFPEETSNSQLRKCHADGNDTEKDCRRQESRAVMQISPLPVQGYPPRSHDIKTGGGDALEDETKEPVGSVGSIQNEASAAEAGGKVKETSVICPEEQLQQDTILIESEIYESAEQYDPSKDDQDGTYEIPASPATLRRLKRAPQPSRRSQSAILGSGVDKITIPRRAGNAPSSDSDSESDFEDLPSVKTGAPAEGVSSLVGNLDEKPSPPPLPILPPESDPESDAYLSPECHKHCPPGPGWRPFHEYDPVYVPRSDPSAMDRRVDSQNYVRGRQRSDSRFGNLYEEIQYGGIYATVDDDDDDDDGGGGEEEEEEDPGGERGGEGGGGRRGQRRAGQGESPAPLGRSHAGHGGPPPPPRTHSPPPPLVPRRTRPISGVADVGRLGLGRTSSLNLPEEPRYSGLIKDDVSDPDDEVPHEYTTLARHSSPSLLEQPRSEVKQTADQVGDDFKLIDDTDSETYGPRVQPSDTQRAAAAEEPPARDLPAPPLPPRLVPSRRARAVTPTGRAGPTKSSTVEDRTECVMFSNGHAVPIEDGMNNETYNVSSDSSDSSDSYEQVDDFNPPPVPAK